MDSNKANKLVGLSIINRKTYNISGRKKKKSVIFDMNYHVVGIFIARESLSTMMAVGACERENDRQCGARRSGEAQRASDGVCLKTNTPRDAASTVHVGEDKKAHHLVVTIYGGGRTTIFVCRVSIEEIRHPESNVFPPCVIKWKSTFVRGTRRPPRRRSEMDRNVLAGFFAPES